MIRSAPFPTSKNSGRSHCPRRCDKIAYCLVGHTSLPYHPIYPQKKLQYSPWCWKAKKSPKYWYIIHRRIIWDSVLWSFSTGPQGQNKKAVKDLSRNMKVWCVRYVVTACDIFDTTCSRFIQKWTVAILIDEENQFSMIFHDHRTYMNISMKSHDSIMIILIYHSHLSLSQTSSFHDILTILHVTNGMVTMVTMVPYYLRQAVASPRRVGPKKEVDRTFLEPLGCNCFGIQHIILRNSQSVFKMLTSAYFVCWFLDAVVFFWTFQIYWNDLGNLSPTFNDILSLDDICDQEIHKFA